MGIAVYIGWGNMAINLIKNNITNFFNGQRIIMACEYKVICLICFRVKPPN